MTMANERAISNCSCKMMNKQNFVQFISPRVAFLSNLPGTPARPLVYLSIHSTICIQLVFHVHYFCSGFTSSSPSLPPPRVVRVPHTLSQPSLSPHLQCFHHFCHRQQCVCACVCARARSTCTEYYLKFELNRFWCTAPLLPSTMASQAAKKPKQFPYATKRQRRPVLYVSCI